MKTTLTVKQAVEAEQQRLVKLNSYQVTEVYERSGSFQHVVAMAAHIFKVPIAVVNFVEENSVLINSTIGVDGFTRIGRDIALCSWAILSDEVTIFENTKEELCLQNNPFVHGKFGLHFYAAAPLKTPDGYSIGLVAIADRKPRSFSGEDANMLQGLAAVVMEELEAKRLLNSSL